MKIREVERGGCIPIGMVMVGNGCLEEEFADATDTIASTSTVPTAGRKYSNRSPFSVLSNTMIILLL